MTVLFGTVEYFVREIARYLGNKTIDGTIEEIYKILYDELKYDFLCDESLRSECITNLTEAYSSFLTSQEGKMEKVLVAN